MFEYNKFWHFWFMLDNRYYARSFNITLRLVILAAMASIFFTVPVFTIAMVSVAVSVLINASMWVFTQFSDFFYHRQNEQLRQVYDNIEDSELKEQVSFYLDKRVVCPRALLVGNSMDLSEPVSSTSRIRAALSVEQDKVLVLVRKKSDFNRNPAFIEEQQRLFIKQAAAKDALSEVAAREMAELVGFSCLIPDNTVASCSHEIETSVGVEEPQPIQLNSAQLFASKDAVRRVLDNKTLSEPRELIEEDVEEDFTTRCVYWFLGYQLDEQDVAVVSKPKVDPEKVQQLVEKFLFQMKASLYRIRASKRASLKLLYVQAWMPGVKDGLQWLQDLFNEPIPDQPVPEVDPAVVPRDKNEVRRDAKTLLNSIDQTSYEDNVLLQMMLGSQDSNAGNTLFFTDPISKKTKLFSVDHERIMPGDNYNMTKSMPFANMIATTKEMRIDNVFPMRIWLIGLPQADVPFSRATMKKVLNNWDPARLVAYHRHKKLFTPAEVGAQLERVQLIRRVFEAECSQSIITLTPKVLFGMFVNNHPSYGFLKDTMKLHDITVYQLLGQISEDADWSLFRHPLQFFQILGKHIAFVKNNGAFSEERPSSFAAKALFGFMAQEEVALECLNQPAMEILEETSTALRGAQA